MRSAVVVIAGIIVIIIAFYSSSFSYKANTETTNKTSNQEPATKEDLVKEMHTDLQKRLAKRVLEGKIDQASVYFAALENPEKLHFAINGAEQYSPASLAKVFMLVEVLKIAENDPSFLQKQLSDKTVQDYLKEMHYAPTESIEKNKFYTIDDITRRMIVHSDNKSYVMLAHETAIDSLNPVFEKLGINAKESWDDYMTVTQYAKLFHILYNAEYLSTESSEYALDLLSETTFKDGLVKQLPSDIKVAHKFGERQNKQGQQLHDCGIIYYPPMPYVLCIMTEGTNVKSQAEVIADVSDEIYDDIEDSKIINPAITPKLKNDSPKKELKEKIKLYNGKKNHKKPLDSLQFPSPTGL